MALALIEAKKKLCREKFITIGELYQFVNYLQKVLNKRDLGIVIAYNLSPFDFNRTNEIIIASDTCAYNLKYLSKNIFNVLTDISIFIDFFISLEKEKLEELENKKMKLNLKAVTNYHTHLN